VPASYDYAERLCGRLARAVQEEREAAGMSRYALEKKCGVSREMTGCIESGDSIPTLHLGARLAYGMGMRLREFLRRLEDEAATELTASPDRLVFRHDSHRQGTRPETPIGGCGHGAAPGAAGARGDGFGEAGTGIGRR
jgi:transcriptional regulator with XRE-family HTH domain